MKRHTLHTPSDSIRGTLDRRRRDGDERRAKGRPCWWHASGEDVFLAEDFRPSAPRQGDKSLCKPRQSFCANQEQWDAPQADDNGSVFAVTTDRMSMGWSGFRRLRAGGGRRSEYSIPAQFRARSLYGQIRAADRRTCRRADCGPALTPLAARRCAPGPWRSSNASVRH
jgi:hypothetical protein